MNEELAKKIKTLNYDELIAYDNAAASANRLISFLGIGSIWLVLNFANFLTILLGVLVVYSLSSLSVGMDNTRKYIRERLETFKKD